MLLKLFTFYEFENAVHGLRLKKGIALSMNHGRAHGRPKINDQKEHEILNDLISGNIGIRKIAAKHGVGVSVVQRIKTELAKQRR